jgi:hypothetical protein
MFQPGITPVVRFDLDSWPGLAGFAAVFFVVGTAIDAVVTDDTVTRAVARGMTVTLCVMVVFAIRLVISRRRSAHG